MVETLLLAVALAHPSTLNSVVTVRDTVTQNYGLGVVTTLGVLTATHIGHDAENLEVCTIGDRKVCVLVRSTKWVGDPQDVELLTLKTPLSLMPAPLSTTPTLPLQVVFYRLMMPGRVVGVTMAHVLGIDVDGDININGGYIGPGVSGGPVINAAGEVEGVVKSAANLGRQSEVCSVPSAMCFLFLDAWTPIMFATPTATALKALEVQ